MESSLSKDAVVGVDDYDGAAAGWGALKAVADAVRGQKAIVKKTRGLLSMNQPHGFDCPGCAWPDPKHTLPRSSFARMGPKPLHGKQRPNGRRPKFSRAIRSANSGTGRISTWRMRAVSHT